MSEHLTADQIEQYRSRRLAPAVLLTVSEHLATCDLCQARVERPLDGNRLFLATRAAVLDDGHDPLQQPRHPSSEEISAYVDGVLTDNARRMVDDHLARCVHCAMSVDELQAFAKHVRNAGDQEGFWASLVGRLRSTALLKRPQLAFGLTLSILAVLVAGLLLRTGRDQAPVSTVAEPGPSSPAIPVPVVAQVHDGGVAIALDANGKLSGAAALPEAYQHLIRDALAGQRLEKARALSDLSRPASSLMGADQEGNQFSVTDPVGKLILADRPTFRWSRLDGASEYVVEIYDDKFNAVAQSPRVATTSWTPSRALPRGILYSWQVKAFKEDREFTSPRPPAPQARFRILDREKADELEQANQKYPSSHLTLGILYAGAGLLDEAAEEFRLFQKENPDSPIPTRLIEDIKAMH